MTHTERNLDCLIIQMNMITSSIIKALICHISVLYGADSSIVVQSKVYQLTFPAIISSLTLSDQPLTTNWL